MPRFNRFVGNIYSAQRFYSLPVGNNVVTASISKLSKASLSPPPSGHEHEVFTHAEASLAKRAGGWGVEAATRVLHNLFTVLPSDYAPISRWVPDKPCGESL